MKKAFTMIELIFVIVIIGILAAIAIPKLSATRDDANIATLIANAKVTLIDFSTFYTAAGNTTWQSSTVAGLTSAPLKTACNTPIVSTTQTSPNIFVVCNDSVICLSFTTIDEGNLTIADGLVTTNAICEAVKNDSAIRAISNKTYKLGGETVVR